MSTDILPYLYLRFLLFLLLIALFSLLCYPRDKFQKFKCSIRFHYSVPCRMFSLNFNILKQENKIKERIVMIFFNITFLPYPYTTRIGSQYGLLVFLRTFFGTELLFLCQSWKVVFQTDYMFPLISLYSKVENQLGRRFYVWV